MTIANDEEYEEIINNMIALTEAQLSELSLYQSSWTKQLKNAMLVNGGKLGNQYGSKKTQQPHQD